MIDFTVIKASRISRARLGLLQTSHGIVETPAFVPVATQAVIKTLDSRDVAEVGCQILIANTFHLHLRPSEKLVQKAGGLHTFMNWPKPLMTDSGGFQVFSLGFGKDFNASKIPKDNKHPVVTIGQQPRLLKITEQGVNFTSYINGDELFMGPKESIAIQERLGADIILAFDECPPPMADKKYVADSVERTHRWAKKCLEWHKTKQALYGIVQGGRYKDLRLKSAKFISCQPFDGFAIGGEFGAGKTDMSKMLHWVMAELPVNKPRHLLGIGYIKDIVRVVKSGVDTFDCIVPTSLARHGVAFTSTGKLDLFKTSFLKDLSPLDKKCGCMVCHGYKRNYIAHLMRAHELTGLKLLTMHNLWYFNNLLFEVREMIKSGKI